MIRDRPAGVLLSQHYEVVDAQDELVGDMKHGTRQQASELRAALQAAGVNGVLVVAEVTERAVIERRVVRLTHG